MAFIEDSDHDGQVVDDGFRMGTDFVGAGLTGLGGLTAAAGGLLAATGGAEAATVFGAPLGMTQATAGALLGLGGAGMAAVGGLLRTDLMGSVAAAAGDFTADKLGLTPTMAPGTDANGNILPQ